MSCWARFLFYFHQHYKYFVAGLYFTAYIAVGAWGDVVIPTLPDISIRTGCNYEELGMIIATRFFSGVAVNLFIGNLYDRFSNLILLFSSISIYIGALSVVFIPWCTNGWQLLIVFTVQGMTHIGYLNGAQSSIIRLFGAKSVSALQFMHLGFGFGNVLGGLLVRPFLATNLSPPAKKICGFNISSSSSNSSLLAMNETFVYDSKIEYAYGILFVWSVIMATFFLITFLLPNNPQSKAVNCAVPDSTVSHKVCCYGLRPNVTSPKHPTLGSFLIANLFAFYFFLNTCSGFTSYSTVYAMDKCKSYFMTQRRATLMNALSSACFSVARILCGLFVSNRPTLYLSFTVCGLFISSMLFAFVAPYYEWALWLSLCLFKFSSGPIFPAGTAWTNIYINVTSSIISVATIGGGIGSIVMWSMGGSLIERHSVFALGYWTFATGALFSLIFFNGVVIAFFIGPKNINLKEKRTRKEDEEEEEG